MTVNIREIMYEDQTGAKLVNEAESLAAELVKYNATRTQIRNIFTEVRQIEASWNVDRTKSMRRLNMLIPKLKYQEKRAEKQGRSPLTPLVNALIGAIRLVSAANDEKEQDELFNKFAQLFEAILAYHHSMGGRG